MMVSTRRIRLILSLLATVGAASFTATSALAATEWQIEGNSLKALGVSEVGVSGKLGESFRLAVPWYASEIICASVAAEGGKIIQGGTSSLTLSMSSCTLTGPPFVAETCKLIQPISFNLKGAVVNHSGAFYELFEPGIEGKPFAIVEFNEGTECPLPLKNEVKGNMVAAFEAGEREQQPLTFSSSIESLFSVDKLSFGGHPATFKGEETIRLKSPYEGSTWAPTFVTGSGEVRLLGSAVLATGASFSGEQIGESTLLIPALNTEVVCKKADFLQGKITNGPAGEGLAEILYLECKYWGTKKVGETTELTTALPCEILEDSASKAAGAILLKVQLKTNLHSEDTYVLAEPDPPGQPLGSILVTAPSECPLPKLVTVTGSTVFKVSLGDLSLKQPEETYVTLEASKTISELFAGDVVKYGINPAYPDAKVLLKLSGAHSACKWGLI